MQFRYTTDPSASGQDLTNALTTALTDNANVIWLVPGGSNIHLAAHIMDSIPDALTSKLTIMLTDERYGLWDHPDSNFFQIGQASFDKKRATFIPTLTRSNASLEATTEAYTKTVDEQFNKADVIIGYFGMGPDGHIAGILPGSPAAQSDNLVIGYRTDTFTRITLGFNAIRQVDIAFLFAFGAEKHSALKRLQTDVPLTDEPAQILKQIPDAYIYNDQIRG